MGRFDKNLNVTRTNIPFFSHCLRDNLASVTGVPKGRERGFWAREKHEGRARKEEGERFPILPSPSRGVSPLKFPSLPFRTTLATQARDNQLTLLSYFYLSS